MHTHHWRIPREGIPSDAWTKIRADAERLFAASPVQIVEGPQRLWTKQRVNELEIKFNAALEAGYEDFYLRREQVPTRQGRWDYVKTALRPYDIVILAILAVIQEHAPRFEIKSDGSKGDWRNALAWAATTLGRPVPSPRLAPADS
jgi:hypothetical protein